MIAGGEESLGGHLRLDVLDQRQEERERAVAPDVVATPREPRALEDTDVVGEELLHCIRVTVRHRFVHAPDDVDVPFAHAQIVVYRPQCVELPGQSARTAARSTRIALPSLTCADYEHATGQGRSWVRATRRHACNTTTLQQGGVQEFARDGGGCRSRSCRRFF